MNKELVDVAAEAATIATLIYHPNFLLTDNMLKPTFFHERDNQCMFWAIESLVASGVENIDALNLGNMLNSDNAVKQVMSKYNITNIQQYIETAHYAARATYEEYKLVAENVVTCAFRRYLDQFSKDIGKECHNMNISLDDLNDFVNNGIDSIAQKFIFGTDTVLFGEKIDEVWEDICDDRNEDGTFGLPSKIATLNDYITFGDGELTLVAGATGRGKSAYFLNEAMYSLQRGVSVMIIDSELTDKVFLPRALANLSGVTVKQIKAGTYTKAEEQKVKESMEWLKKQPFIHQYDPVFSKIKVEQSVRKWKNQKNLGLLIYDYIKPSEKYGAADISQSLGIMTDFLKNNIAGSLSMPVIAGIQLNKQTQTVADSQKPERYADTLMYWKAKSVDELRQDGLDCGNFKIEIGKNRNGSTTAEGEYLDIMFQGDLMRISEAKKHEVGTNLPFADKEGVDDTKK